MLEIYNTNRLYKCSNSLLYIYLHVDIIPSSYIHLYIIY